MRDMCKTLSIVDTWQMFNEDSFMKEFYQKDSVSMFLLTTNHLSTTVTFPNGQACPQMSLLWICV